MTILLIAMVNLTLSINKLYEYIDTLYWVSDRSTDAKTEWNGDIFEWLSRVNEEDYE